MGGLSRKLMHQVESTMAETAAIQVAQMEEQRISNPYHYDLGWIMVDDIGDVAIKMKDDARSVDYPGKLGNVQYIAQRLRLSE